MRFLAFLIVAVVLIPAAGAGGAAFLTPNQLSNHADWLMSMRRQNSLARLKARHGFESTEATA